MADKYTGLGSTVGLDGDLGDFGDVVFQGDERIRSSSECVMADKYTGLGSPA